MHLLPWIRTKEPALFGANESWNLLSDSNSVGNRSPVRLFISRLDIVDDEEEEDARVVRGIKDTIAFDMMSDMV